MKLWKRAVFTAAFFAFVLSLTITGMAKKDDDDEEEINGCTLRVTYSIEADSDLGDFDVVASGNRCSVNSWTFVDAGSSWKAGEIPKVKVEVVAEDGYVFSSKVNAGKITLKGDSATCTGVKRLNSGESLEITLRLKAVKGEMGEIEDAFWVSSPVGKAKWDTAENASAYEVRLYLGNKCVKTVDKTTTNYYDFHPYMTEKGDYYFKVRPIPKNHNESEYLNTGAWVTSDELTIDRTNVASRNSGESNLDGPVGNDAYVNGDHPAFGWVAENGKWWYHASDGSYPAGQWSYIDGKWYLFDKAGYMMTGWQLWNNAYYFLTINGDMATGWIEDNKRWYYLNPEDGHMTTGWLDTNNKRFYFNTDGSMAVGWTNVGGKWYYFYPNDGSMARNTTVGTRYVNGDGVWVQ